MLLQCRVLGRGWGTEFGNNSYHSFSSHPCCSVFEAISHNDRASPSTTGLISHGASPLFECTELCFFHLCKESVPRCHELLSII